MSSVIRNRSSKSQALEVIDTLLLLVLVIVSAVRCQISESLPTSWRVTGPAGTADIGGASITTMLLFAGIIFTAAAVWLAVHIKQGQLNWRRSFLLGPLLLLTAAGVYSGTAASNKTAATVAVVNLLSQIAGAILLVQLLDRPWKRRLLLAAIAATGLVMAQRCWEQHLEEIPHTIAMYHENPNEVLASQGIEPGTYQADQYARRLMSRDIGGYLLISNTAAAFFILSLGATAALILSGGWLRRFKGWYALVFIGSLAVLGAQMSALILTQSKGGIGAAVIAAGVVQLLWLVKGWVVRHWRAILAAAGIMIILGIAAAAAYGIEHGRLPSNSMWVRWQYWQASAAMIGQHWLRGVGPDNFGQYYTRYMAAAAPEVIRDPHSLLISIWSQWGLAGLAGVIWAILAVAINLARPLAPLSDLKNPVQPDYDQQQRMWLYGIIAAIAVMLIRLAVTELGDVPLIVRLSVYLITLLIPAGVWLAGFMVMAALGRQGPGLPAERGGDDDMTALVLGGGLLGFLLQNNFDFSIFQPGVGTCFFALAAVALAAKRLQEPSKKNLTIKIKHGKVTALAVLMAAALLWLVIIIPIATAQQLMEQAQRQALAGNYTAAGQLAGQAEKFDRLNPEIPNFLTQLHLVQWQLAGDKPSGYLDDAIANGERAIQRDPANYKFYRQLSEVYLLAAQNRQDGKYDREKALSYMRQAVSRYPTSSALLIQYGRLLQDKGQLKEAMHQYEKALQNEEAFLRQQQQMYPDRKQLSPRLDPQLSRRAQEEINRISPHDN